MRPETEELSELELERLRAAIERRHEDLRAQIAERRGALEREQLADDATGDEADKAFARTRAGVESELIDRYLVELGQLETARTRMDEGTFGICVDCGNQIGLGRLEANPAALRCARCQTLRENVFAETHQAPLRLRHAGRR